jgi:hypothetical protein
MVGGADGKVVVDRDHKGWRRDPEERRYDEPVTEQRGASGNVKRQDQKLESQCTNHFQNYSAFAVAASGE